MIKVACVGIIEDNNGKILITKRSIPPFQYQYVMPGGKLDKGESVFHCVKREVFEEIGLRDSHYNVKGELSPEHTVSTNFLVHTYIAETLTIPKFNINKKEVEKIILVPIKHLKNKRYHVKVPLKLNEKLYFNTFYYYKKHLIWGATSRILDNFLKNHG
jgi:mutator protein MutT